MLSVPIWDFGDCLERLACHFNPRDLTDDLAPEAKCQLCQLAEKETGIPAVFVPGFPPRFSEGGAERMVAPSGVEGCFCTIIRQLHRYTFLAFLF
jgi:hypothetical protein